MSDYFFSARLAYPWSVDPLGPVALAAVAALLALFTVWTYLGHPQASRRRVLLILALRLLALLVALITAARPSLGVNENPKQPSTLLIGVDVSESMTVKDEAGDRTRGEAVRRTLDRCQPLFEELLAEQGISVVLYKFGPADFSEPTARYDADAPFDAPQSDYGAYLNRTYDRWQAERVRGHLLIGDGANNGERFVPAAESERWGRRGVPVATFLVGKESSGTDTKDVAVESIVCTPSPAFLKADFTVTARVNAYNYPGARVTARAFIDDEPKAIEEFTLDREKGNELKLTLKAPDQKGEYKIKVQVGVLKGGKLEPLPGELSPLNNWSETYLTVLKEGVRVLLIDQDRWEATLLRDTLRTEKRFDVYQAPFQRGGGFAPEVRELLNLEAQAYDVVIIGNVSGNDIRKAAPNFLDELTRLRLTKGVGVMFLGGEFAYEGIPGELLPVAGGPLVDALDAEGNPLDQAQFVTVPTPAGLNKMFKLPPRPDPSNKGAPLTAARQWDALHEGVRTGIRLNGHSRITLRPGGQDTVFAWTQRLNKGRFDATGQVELTPGAKGELAAGTEFDPAAHEPLLVGSQVGDKSKGRWLAFGAFDTYLWRGLGQPRERTGLDLHERFWRQCVLYLAYQDEEEGQAYARPLYRQMKVTGEQTVRVGLKKADGTDDPKAPLTVRIVPLEKGQREPRPEDEKRATPLALSADKDGRKVLFRPPVPGEYFVSVEGDETVPDPSNDKKTVTRRHRGTAKFIVTPDSSDEMLRRAADPDLMRNLAVPTGGQALRLEDLPQFLRELKTELPPDAGKKPRFYPDWNRNRSRGFLPFWLVVFVALLGTEWGLRRLWGLV